MEALYFIRDNWQFLAGVLSLLLGWFGLDAKFTKWLGLAEQKHKDAKQWAKSKDIHKAAKTAYGVVSKLSRKTATDLDDKLAKGLEEALRIMESLGWDKSEIANGEKDVIRKIFDALHELEHVQLEAAAGTAVSHKAADAGVTAAPLGFGSSS